MSSALEKTGFGWGVEQRMGCGVQDCHVFELMHISNIIDYHARLTDSPNVTLCLHTWQANGLFNMAS